jgi:hypothetical protein
VTVAPGVDGAAVVGVSLLGVVTCAPGVLGAFVAGAAAFGLAVDGDAGSAIAPGDVVVVTPLDFFDVSGCVDCCAAAGSDSAVSSAAAST